MFFNSNKSKKSPLEQGALLSVYPIIPIVLLTITSQVINIYFPNFSAEPLIKLTAKSIYPIISGAIAYSIGGMQALPSGILGGLLANSGISITEQSSASLGASGLYGCIMAGKIAGKSLLLIRRLSILKSKAEQYPFNISASVGNMGITLLSTLTINEISTHINSFTTLSLSALCSALPLLGCVAAGITIAMGGSGPVYSAGYLFATAAHATGQGEPLTSIFAATLVPGISIGVFALLYSRKFSYTEKYCSITSLAGSLLGISYSTIPFYTAKPIKMIVPALPGGCAASLICTLLRCNITEVPKNIFYLTSMEKPLYFLLGVTCGVLISVFIMSLVFDTCAENETENKEAVKNAIGNPA